jgi:RsiW-degrading membrane proteinase PrsW (M82 family)
MNRSGALLAVCFSAGVIGGLADSLAAWFCGAWGITNLAGVAIAPELNPAWLYPRLIWGGIWGLAYFFTVGSHGTRRRWVRKGLLVSLLPTLFQLFYMFPYRTAFGPMGMGLGTLTPLFVLLFNFVWGFFTGLFTRTLWGRG